MAKSFTYDVLQVFSRIPMLTGLDLTLRNNVWEGRYYIDGKRHAYRRDKLKVKIWAARGGADIWLFEQGGRAMSLATWLVSHGGCANYKEAYSAIRSGGRLVDMEFQRDFLRGGGAGVVTEAYVPEGEYLPYAAIPLWQCPLYRWMCGLFGEREVSRCFFDYKVTTDERGLVVWWYIDAEGRICHDKRMRYREDGHRDKCFGGTRTYRTADGYTSRPLFGSHLLASDGELGRFGGVLSDLCSSILPNIEKAVKSQKTLVVESEKTALLARMAFGGVWLATGGKSQTCRLDADAVLFPDVDAVSEWEARGEVCEWWMDAESSGFEVGEKWDLGDFIERLARTRAAN